MMNSLLTKKNALLIAVILLASCSQNSPGSKISEDASEVEQKK